TITGCAEQSPPISATYKLTDWKDAQIAIDRASSGDEIDLSQLWSPEVQYSFSVPANLSLRLIGRENVVFYGVSFTFAGQNTITIENLSIVTTNNQAASALGFSGTGNFLTIEGTNSIIVATAPAKAGSGAAIGVPDGTDLEINGSGVLAVAGNNGGAGIGGGLEKPGGSITIDIDKQAVITAYCQAGGAGIGGGLKASGGTTRIATGNINVIEKASSNSSADDTGSGAGIGGGAAGDGGVIVVSGGSIQVSQSSSSAGIGGGSGGAGGNITISGGSIKASNYGSGPAIGGGSVTIAGGVAGAPANITMQGGSLAAQSTTRAINGTFSELPAAYHWQADSQFDGSEAESRVYPGDSFLGSDTYRSVSIASAEVIGVTISPASVEVPKGGTQQFSASVQTTGGASNEFRWSLYGHSAQGTFINAEGILTVATNETSVTVTVVATSTFNNAITATATVTIIGAPRTSGQ
ncbi:MAG: hypothetical protein LBU61_04105, partial [Coriobacteriales bacterium]|nr:hypothetical protein [Coriobacteriales bacterium]